MASQCKLVHKTYVSLIVQDCSYLDNNRLCVHKCQKIYSTHMERLPLLGV